MVWGLLWAAILVLTCQIKSHSCHHPPTVWLNESYYTDKHVYSHPTKRQKIDLKRSSKCVGSVRHGKHRVDHPLLSPPPFYKPRKQNKNGGTDSGMSALSMVSTTHSEKKTSVHQLVANRLSVDHFPVYQHRDNGREAFAISQAESCT